MSLMEGANEKVFDAVRELSRDVSARLTKGRTKRRVNMNKGKDN